MEELWKDIEGYKGLYQVSNLGRVKSLNYMGHKGTVKCLQTHIDSWGYRKVGLTKDRIVKYIFIHVLVAKAFISNPDPINKTQVNHIDGNKLNNCVTNLEWVTPKENIQHAINTGLRSKGFPFQMPIGKEHHSSKSIGQYDLHGNLIKIWDCISDVSRYYNCAIPPIVNCAKGRIKTYLGYIWKEFEDNNYPDKITVTPNRLSPRIIQQYSLDGELLKTWNGYKQIIEATNNQYKYSQLAACCSGAKKTAYGYIWRSIFI